MTTVGRSIAHDSAAGHVCGEALYIEDMPATAGELWAEFVGSPVAHGRLESIEASAALAMPGVVAVYTAKDIPGRNHWGPIFHDEPFLADGELMYVGQPVAIIAATSRDAARRARKAVKVAVRELPAVLSIEDALAADDFLQPARRMARGDFASAYASAPHTMEGTFRIGGQEQFYLESQAALAIPGELGQVTVHSSTQNPTEVQAVVGEGLGLAMHQVVCICKRMGGGFGGKETQAAIPAFMAALVATKTGKACRVVYTKDDDMKVTGKRHEYLVEYKVGYDGDGRLLAVHFQFWSNGGAYCDLSTSVLERTMMHADNCYWMPNVAIDARVCRTHLPPNTAFRGFGGPQGVAAIENIIEEIAAELGKDALDVRLANLYGIEERNTTPYGQVVRNNMLHAIFAQLEESSDYRRRAAAVAEFNRTSKTHLRGLSMTGVKFGISFTTKFLNQGNALVNVYYDGTVQVSTGATEMGQGVNIKMAQIVADEFGLGIDRVIVMATSTEKNINTSPTAASASADLNGFAAQRAAREIRTRLAEYAARILAEPSLGVDASPVCIHFAGGHVFDERRPEVRIPFGELTTRARRDRVDLGARGHYATPGVDFNRETGKGTPFLYYTQGACAAEVLVDRFTGDLKLDRIDLLMDIGNMVNPGIDRGQVIGGLVQGLGWATAECLVYNERGELLSHSPTTYKIPGIDDIPRDFRVDFIENSGNTRNIYGSKAVGEPPLLLGVCAFTAAKNAVAALGDGAKLSLPATGEEMLMAITAASREEAMATSGG